MEKGRWMDEENKSWWMKLKGSCKIVPEPAQSLITLAGSDQVCQRLVWGLSTKQRCRSAFTNWWEQKNEFGQVASCAWIPDPARRRLGSMGGNVCGVRELWESWPLVCSHFSCQQAFKCFYFGWQCLIKQQITGWWRMCSLVPSNQRE